MENMDRLSLISIDQIQGVNNANECEFILDELRNVEIQNGQEKVDITGYKGRKLGSLKKNKTMSITGTNGLLVGGLLAAQVGGEVSEAGTQTVRMTEIVTVNSNAATLTGTPIGTSGNELVKVFVKNPNGSLGKAFTQDSTASAGKFSFTTKTITFNEGEVVDGTEIVCFYDASVNGVKISNDSEKYSKVLKLYVDCTAQDTCDRQYHVQFIIPRADFSGEFTFSIGEDPMTHGFEAEGLAGGCGKISNYWDMIVFADEA